MPENKEYVSKYRVVRDTHPLSMTVDTITGTITFSNREDVGSMDDAVMFSIGMNHWKNLGSPNSLIITANEAVNN